MDGNSIQDKIDKLVQQPTIKSHDYHISIAL